MSWFSTPVKSQSVILLFSTVPCKEPKMDSNNNCVVVKAGLTIFTDNGGARNAKADAQGVLKEIIGFGLFNYRRMGIIRGTWS